MNDRPASPASPGPQFVRRVPEGDTQERFVCGDCGHVHYVNPKLVAGAVVVHDGLILLCKRAISPRRGFWTLPAGFLEEQESPQAGAAREAREEACCEIAIDALLAVYTLAHISQVQLIYRARLAAPTFSPGAESLQTSLFAWDEIPWSELAFPSTAWALRHWREVETEEVFAPFTNPA